MANSHQVNLKVLRAMEKECADVCGYERFQLGFRNGHVAVDEYNPDGVCQRTYRAGLTKKEAYYVLYDLCYVNKMKKYR